MNDRPMQNHQPSKSRRKPRPAGKGAAMQATNPALERPAQDGDNLQQEIRLLRLLIRQVEELAGEERPMDELLSMMEVVSKSCTRLATLLKASRDLGGGESLSDALSQAVRELRAEWGVEGRK